VNILYDASIFGQKYGGISRYFYEIIRRIADTPAANVLLFQGFYANKYPLRSYRHKYKFYFGLRRPAIPKTTRLFNGLNHFLFRRFINLTKLDRLVYHPTYYSGALAQVRKPTRIVLTVYDMVCELFPQYFKNANREIENKRNSIKRADHIICISENTRNDLVRLCNVNQDNVSVIYLGSSINAQDIAALEPRPPAARPYILYVGPRQTPYKNFTLLLSAFVDGCLFKDFDLLCVGSGRFTAAESARFRVLNLTDQLCHIDPDDVSLATAYKNAACLVYPSLYEGFGFPVLEAMSAGCPVVAANSSSIREVAGDAAVLFDPLDVDCLIQALRRVLYSSHVQNTLREAGYVQSRKFNWDTTVEQTLQVYANLV
jgi:glycosyltransferase involved in cell wall biosynthesis